MTLATRRTAALRLAAVAAAGRLALGGAGMGWGIGAQSQTAPASNNEISQLSAERTDEGLFVSATLDFDLPRAVEDALNKGIPIQFVAEADVVRPRWYWWERRNVAAQRVWRLSYAPLTRRYRLTLGSPGGLGTGLGGATSMGQNFEALADALAVMRRIARWRVLEARDLEDDARDARLAVELRFRLDTAALPRPLQISVGAQPEWNLSLARRANVLVAPAAP